MLIYSLNIFEESILEVKIQNTKIGIQKYRLRLIQVTSN